MELDQSCNTMTQEQLDEVVRQHGLWLDSDGKKGKKADLSKQRLVGLNLQRANLSHATLRGADLRQADFRLAYLKDADLQGSCFQGTILHTACLIGANFWKADLDGADFYTAFIDDNIKSACNWQQAVGLDLPINSPTADLEQQIRQQSQQINKLQKELAQTVANSSETKRLQEELKQAQQEKAYTEAELQKIKDDAKANLSKEIDKAQQALSEIFKEGMQKQIDEHKKSARYIGFFALSLIAVDFLLVIGFICSYWREKITNNGGTALDWSFAAHSFPVLVILVLATTLLRHQKKLLDEVRHFSAAKHQVELYSGLLKASQHAAAHLNDPSKSADYVQETFGKIRDKLLQYQFAVPADGKDGDAGGAADKLVDKIIEKAVSGGKGGS